MSALKADFNYRKPLKPDEEKPSFGLTEGDPSMPNHKSFAKEVHNARESNFKIEDGGFELINHKSAVKNFYDDDEIVKRMSGRRMHPESGRVYHIKYNPPKNEGKYHITNKDLKTEEH